jgi:hypothetical protein
MKPKVSCICPTRGRFETLRESISFFILQDYPNKEMIIFNNHSEPLEAHPKLAKHNIKVINAGDYAGQSMQKVYADCLKHVSEDSEYVAIWDDDDFYLPYHLSSGMEIISEKNALAVRSTGGYWQDNLNPQGDHYTIVKNTLEASMIVKKEFIFFNESNQNPTSQEYTHPHLPWMDKFSLIDKKTFEYNSNITAVFRWHFENNYNHLQSSGPHNNNSDLGIGKILKPKDVSHLFYDLLKKIYLTITPDGKVRQITSDEKSKLYEKFVSYNLDLFGHIDKYKVWLYWNDENKIPIFIKECFRSIVENTFAKCVILNDNSLRTYNVPDYVWNLNSVEKSEFIRVYFLNKYGGWWFDADTYVVGDLDKHYFNHLINNECYFPSEYNVPGKITTPLLCSKPNGLIIRTAWNKVDTFLKASVVPYKLGWAKLNFVGILETADEYTYTLGWHFITANNLVKWNYNNDRITEWNFDNIDMSKLQIYILHWSQIGAEMSWKIDVNSQNDFYKIGESYPNLKTLFEKSNSKY